MQQFPPTLALNADFQPLSWFPLSTWGMEQTMYQLCKGRVSVVEEYEIPIRSPNLTIMLPSVVAMKQYKPGKKLVSFTRFNIFLRDGFCCQYCSKQFNPKDLTFDHRIPRTLGGKTTWENIVTSCTACNALKGHKLAMRPLREPWRPSVHELQSQGRKFPPKYLHEKWVDYLYWDVPLDET